MKCHICNAPLRIEITSIEMDIPKHEKLSTFKFDTSALSDLIQIFCSENKAHEQLHSVTTKLQYEIAAALVQKYRNIVLKYFQ